MKKNQQFQQDSTAIDAIYREFVSVLCSGLAEISALKHENKNKDQDFWHALLSLVEIFSCQYCSAKDYRQYNPKSDTHSGSFRLFRQWLARQTKQQKQVAARSDKNIKYISLDIFDEDFMSLNCIPKAHYTHYRVFNLYLNIAFLVDLLNVFLELIPLENPAHGKLGGVVSHLQSFFEGASSEIESELDDFLKHNIKDMSLFALLGRILSGRQVLLFNLVIKTGSAHLIQNINFQSAQIEFFAKHGKRLNRFNLAA